MGVMNGGSTDRGERLGPGSTGLDHAAATTTHHSALRLPREILQRRQLDAETMRNPLRLRYRVAKRARDHQCCKGSLQRVR